MPPNRRANGMATPKSGSVNTPANENDGWEDVAQESQVIFDTIGDTFIGVFQGWTETPGKGIPQAHFTNDEGQFFVNCGWSLKQQLREVKKGTLCRLMYVSNQDTGQDTPMMVFRVQTKKS